MTSAPKTLPDYDLPHAHDSSCWWNWEQARWVCRPEAQAERPLVDIRDMLVVHTALLREFRLAAAAVRRVAPGDRTQTARVGQHLDLLLTLLEHHHAGEDELVWPLVRERAPSCLNVAAEIDAQHGGIDRVSQHVRERRAAWIASRAEADREHLAADLEDLYERLRDHLDLEERSLLPLAAMVCTPEEWHAVGEAAVAALPKQQLPLTFGMFAYEGDPEVLQAMLSAAPLVPRKVLPRLAPRIYARRARRVHGTATP